MLERGVPQEHALHAPVDALGVQLRQFDLLWGVFAKENETDETVTVCRR